MDEEGNPKGVSVQSFPLERVGRGPAFGVCSGSLDSFQVIDRVKDGDVVFDTSESLPSVGNETRFVMEGYYFQPSCRRFVRTAGNEMKLSIVQPMLPLESTDGVSNNQPELSHCA